VPRIAFCHDSFTAFMAKIFMAFMAKFMTRLDDRLVEGRGAGDLTDDGGRQVAEL
jgi:hypothetical protein